MSKKAGIKFETALKRLENIVEELEHSELDLDKSLEIFEEGVNLTKICSKRLDKAEQKIELLLRDREGNISPTDFDPGENNEDSV